MAFNPEIHHRRSIRLKGYDYSWDGAYFVTVCTKDREHLFGEIIAGEMSENEAGEMVKKIWIEIPDYYPRFKVDHFVVMPNHFHGIIIKGNVGAGPCACPKQINSNDGATTGSRPYNFSLYDVIERFKSLTTYRYIEGIDNSNWEPFNGKLWQRNYYEHIIQNDRELSTYRQYIQDNPSKWEEDEYFFKFDKRKQD